MFDVKEMGKKIRKLRGKISQDECADNLGISRGALSFYEQGKRTPDAEILYRMCEHFKVSSDYLLGISPYSTTDTDLQAVCAFTGLNENAIENIVNRTSMPEPKYDKFTKTAYPTTPFTAKYYEDNQKILNKILSSSPFWSIVLHYNFMNSFVNNSFALEDNYKKALENFRKGANYDAAYDALEKITQNCSDIDVTRYYITREIEKLNDIFDFRTDNTLIPESDEHDLTDNLPFDVKEDSNAKHNPKKE